MKNYCNKKKMEQRFRDRWKSKMEGRPITNNQCVYINK